VDANTVERHGRRTDVVRTRFTHIAYESRRWRPLGCDSG
jgi:hypothetical protein